VSHYTVVASGRLDNGVAFNLLFVEVDLDLVVDALGQNGPGHSRSAVD
jgi:hypothetical protein